MPVGNNFQYSQYVRSDPTERVRYREIQPTAAAASPAWLDAMARHGVQLHAAGVRAILFVHGTHLGTDVFGMQRLDDVGGLRRGYSRGISGLDAASSRRESTGKFQIRSPASVPSGQRSIITWVEAWRPTDCSSGSRPS